MHQSVDNVLDGLGEKRQQQQRVNRRKAVYCSDTALKFYA